ncbi:MAG: TetR/AcrR family transcriptional regulator [Eubacteriales bacterium]|nr:TetR/AcrR family transcriptional regulator [Eubacteriales bacterium]
MGTYAEAREKTRNNLVNAFWDLYCEKDINKITIKEITDRAGYNRATFYIYFKNAQQVLDYVEEQLYSQMALYHADMQKPKNKEEAERRLSESIAQLDENRRFLCVLLSERGDPKFASDFREHFRSQISRIVETGDLEATVPLDFALDFIIGGIVNCLQRWYETQPETSSLQLIQNIFAAAFRGMFRFPKQGSAPEKATFCR